MKTIAMLAVLMVPSMAAAAAPMTASTYVMKAGASDQYEIQSSKLVLASSKNSGLRDFANMMVTDHTKSTADVKAAAAESHVKAAPPALDAMGRKNVAALKAAHGTARDTLYIAQQKKAHQAALAVQQGYAANGSAPALKAAAADIVPVVQHHIELLSSM